MHCYLLKWRLSQSLFERRSSTGLNHTHKWWILWCWYDPAANAQVAAYSLLTSENHLRVLRIMSVAMWAITLKGGEAARTSGAFIRRVEAVRVPAMTFKIVAMSKYFSASAARYCPVTGSTSGGPFFVSFSHFNIINGYYVFRIFQN